MIGYILQGMIWTVFITLSSFAIGAVRGVAVAGA